MFIDFTHLLHYQNVDESGSLSTFNFVNAIVKDYNRFEVYLRKAVT
jgi:hypothetical protein